MTVPSGSPGSTSPDTRDDGILYLDDRDPSRSLGTLVLLFAVCLALLVLVRLLVPQLSGHSDQAVAEQMRCANNLSQIALALHRYHTRYDCLPPAYTTDNQGRPMHSWRVFLLPFLEPQDLDLQYDWDRPWDSPGNLKLLQQMPSIFRCPTSDCPEGYTHYVVVIGDPQQFPQTMFTPDRSICWDDVSDGASDTLLVVEVERAVPWTMPAADLYWKRMNMRVDRGPASISSPHRSVANVALGDGSIRTFDSSLCEETLRHLIQPADGSPAYDSRRTIWSSNRRRAKTKGGLALP